MWSTASARCTPPGWGRSTRWIVPKGQELSLIHIYAALYVCINHQAASVAKLLLDKGIDLEQYQAWAEWQRKNEGYEDTMEELTEYWSELQSGPQQGCPSMDGMSL